MFCNLLSQEPLSWTLYTVTLIAYAKNKTIYIQHTTYLYSQKYPITH